MTALELARQTLMQLSKSQSPPTPDNYRLVYNQIAGIEAENNDTILSKVLDKVLHDLGKDKPKYLAAAQKISTLVKKRDSANLENLIYSLLPLGASDSVNWSALLRYLLKQLDLNHSGITLSRKKEGLSRVLINFADDPNQLGQKIQALMTSWGNAQAVMIVNEDNAVESVNAKVLSPAPHEGALVAQPVHKIDDNVQLKIAIAWRDLLIRTISLVVLPQFTDIPAAISRIEALITRAQHSNTTEEVNDFSESLKSTLLRAEMQTDSQHRMQMR